MSYLWSKNAEHIQSLFRPWQNGDGLDESILCGAEQTLSLKFPNILRNYYLSWGRRNDYNQSNGLLLSPKETFEHLGHFVFCIENQAVNFWGIPIPQLNEIDPPVNFIYNENTDFEWKFSHKNLSTFLDVLLYGHAFSKGAVHGATFHMSDEGLNAAEKAIKELFIKVQLDSEPWGIRPSQEWDRWILYMNSGIAIDISYMAMGVFAVARNEKELQNLRLLIGMDWDETW